jgi:hypothetical protein
MLYSQHTQYFCVFEVRFSPFRVCLHGVGSMTDEAWTEVTTAHPEIAEFRNAPIEFAEQMQQALAGKVATFEHDVTATNLRAELSETKKSQSASPLWVQAAEIWWSCWSFRGR